ncbi:TetR/AcrR family transcriptional regulator [Streptomyces sp. 8N706]|uniref:TetR/AcrR family transcriptional regulator n=1 Tax=Streptomyces sp. 8N706 TaxID=3457416 RepID=UPI003FD1E36F
MAQLGRREQHKEATRQALHRAAHQMFEERGYERTTVRDIASAAGVTERTFFRYFPSKEDLIRGEILDLIPLLQEHIRARPAEESDPAAVLNAILNTLAEHGDPGVLFSGPPARNLPVPKQSAVTLLVQFEDGIEVVLAERLASRAGDDRDVRLRTGVLARAFAGAMRSALAAYAALSEREKTPTTAERLLRSAFAALRDAADPVPEAAGTGDGR